MSPTRTATCYVAAIVTGLASSVGVLLLAGIMSGRVTETETLRREAWDTELYWLIGLPLCYLVAGVLGWLGPERIWRWPLVMMATQALVMLLFSGSDFSLLPLGLILFAILALPGIFTAWVGRCMRRFTDADRGELLRPGFHSERGKNQSAGAPPSALRRSTKAESSSSIAGSRGGCW